jgi:hypothetical protein
MSNFYRAPLSVDAPGIVDEIRERFRVGGKPLDGAAVLAVIERINDATYDADGPVWMTPNIDSKGARIHGVPLQIGGRVVRYVSQEELAVFPVREAS